MRDTPMVRTMRSTLASTCSAFGAWMYLDPNTFPMSEGSEHDSEVLRIIERCLSSEERKDQLTRRIENQTQRETMIQLRLALEKEKWSPDLEDQVSEFRSRLAEILSVLSEVQIDSMESAENVGDSTKLQDRVSAEVITAEKSMDREERRISRQESEQLGKEQEIIPGEEAKSRRGRRLRPEDEQKDPARG